MTDAAEVLRRGIRRVALAQAVITLSLVAVFWYVRDSGEALGALYGGATALLISVWLGRGVKRAGALPHQGAVLGALYANTVMRYVAAIVLLGLGLGSLKLAPIPLVCAFVAAQFGVLANIRQG